MGYLHYQPHNAHAVEVKGRRMLFHIPTSALFELDGLDDAVLRFLTEKGRIGEDEVKARFADRDPAEVAGKLKSFLALDILSDGLSRKPDGPPVSIERFPLTTIVLNVNTGCNLACSYCYKEDLVAPNAGQRMAFETAVRSIELLLEESPERDGYNIVFFGGEPLSNLPLIRQVVEYAERLGLERGKHFDYTLTTNATLLNEEIVDWLDRHRFGITVSMDGPKHLHDRNRKTVGGRGSYETVANKVRTLLQRYRSRPVGARVTLTKGVTAVEEIFAHLMDEFGFAEVGFSPVTAGDMAAFNLDGGELDEVFEGMKALGRQYRDAAKSGRNLGFSNMHQLMQDLWEGRSKALPCGAGVGMLAVDHKGGLNLCHRFTGSTMPTFGDVETGIDKKSLGGFIEDRASRAGKACETCRIRNLCAGGCYHESYAHFTDPLKPTYHYCDLMRSWIDFGIGVYGELIATSPEFFNRYIAPRRAFGK